MTAELVLILGSIGSALLGLIGIRLIQHDNTPILDLLTEDELRSYRISRLVEGIGYCTIGKHEFRLAPGGSQTVCPECLPPLPVPVRADAHYEPERESRALNFGKSYAPLYTWWPDLFQKGKEQ